MKSPTSTRKDKKKGAKPASQAAGGKGAAHKAGSPKKKAPPPREPNRSTPPRSRKAATSASKKVSPMAVASSPGKTTRNKMSAGKGGKGVSSGAYNGTVPQSANGPGTRQPGPAGSTGSTGSSGSSVKSRTPSTNKSDTILSPKEAKLHFDMARTPKHSNTKKGGEKKKGTAPLPSMPPQNLGNILSESKLSSSNIKNGSGINGKKEKNESSTKNDTGKKAKGSKGHKGPNLNLVIPTSPPAAYPATRSNRPSHQVPPNRPDSPGNRDGSPSDDPEMTRMPPPGAHPGHPGHPTYPRHPPRYYSPEYDYPHPNATPPSPHRVHPSRPRRHRVPPSHSHEYSPDHVAHAAPGDPHGDPRDPRDPRAGPNGQWYYDDYYQEYPEYYRGRGYSVSSESGAGGSGGAGAGEDHHYPPPHHPPHPHHAHHPHSKSKYPTTPHPTSDKDPDNSSLRAVSSSFSDSKSLKSKSEGNYKAYGATPPTMESEPSPGLTAVTHSTDGMPTLEGQEGHEGIPVQPKLSSSMDESLAHASHAPHASHASHAALTAQGEDESPANASAVSAVSKASADFSWRQLHQIASVDKDELLRLQNSKSEENEIRAKELVVPTRQRDGPGNAGNVGNVGNGRAKRGQDHPAPGNGTGGAAVSNGVRGAGEEADSPHGEVRESISRTSSLSNSPTDEEYPQGSTPQGHSSSLPTPSKLKYLNSLSSVASEQKPLPSNDPNDPHTLRSRHYPPSGPYDPHESVEDHHEHHDHHVYHDEHSPSASTISTKDTRSYYPPYPSHPEQALRGAPKAKPNAAMDGMKPKHPFHLKTRAGAGNGANADVPPGPPGPPGHPLPPGHPMPEEAGNPVNPDYSTKRRRLNGGMRPERMYPPGKYPSPPSAAYPPYPHPPHEEDDVTMMEEPDLAVVPSWETSGKAGWSVCSGMTGMTMEGLNDGGGSVGGPGMSAFSFSSDHKKASAPGATSSVVGSSSVGSLGSKRRKGVGAGGPDEDVEQEHPHHSSPERPYPPKESPYHRGGPPHLHDERRRKAGAHVQFSRDPTYMEHSAKRPHGAHGAHGMAPPPPHPSHRYRDDYYYDGAPPHAMHPPHPGLPPSSSYDYPLSPPPPGHPRYHRHRDLYDDYYDYGAYPPHPSHAPHAPPPHVGYPHHPRYDPRRHPPPGYSHDHYPYPMKHRPTPPHAAHPPHDYPDYPPAVTSSGMPMGSPPHYPSASSMPPHVRSALRKPWPGHDPKFPSSRAHGANGTHGSGLGGLGAHHTPSHLAHLALLHGRGGGGYGGLGGFGGLGGQGGWSKEDDYALMEIMKKFKNPKNWEPIASRLDRGKSAEECQDRWTRFLKPGARKGQWTEAEDAIVIEAVATSLEDPFTRWSELAHQLPGRVGKQVRDRWVNHLNPNINHRPFSKEDDLLLWEGHKALGKRWVEISTKYFNSTRSENHIKNRWYSASFKKFIAGEFGPDAYKKVHDGTDNDDQDKENDGNDGDSSLDNGASQVSQDSKQSSVKESLPAQAVVV